MNITNTSSRKSHHNACLIHCCMQYKKLQSDHLSIAPDMKRSDSKVYRVSPAVPAHVQPQLAPPLPNGTGKKGIFGFTKRKQGQLSFAQPQSISAVQMCQQTATTTGRALPMGSQMALPTGQLFTESQVKVAMNQPQAAVMVSVHQQQSMSAQVPVAPQHQYQQTDIIERKIDEILMEATWIKKIYTTTLSEISTGVDQYKESNVAKGIDCCCKAVSCSNLFKREPTEVRRSLELTKNLQFARNKGIATVTWTMLQEVFTKAPIGATVKEINVYFQAIMAIIFSIITLVSVIRAKGRNPFDIAELTLGTIGLVYVMFDALYHFICNTIQCKVCRKWRNYYYESKNMTEHDDTISKSHDSNKCCQECCGKNKCTTIIDVARVFVSELLFYPALLLSLFQFAQEYADGGGVNIFTWIKTIASLLQEIGPVYFARMFILAGTVWSIQKVRNATQNTKSGGSTKNKFSWKGAIFHILFVAQTYCQMFIQIAMIVIIVGKYYNEYLHHTMGPIITQSNMTTPSDIPTMTAPTTPSDIPAAGRYMPSPGLIYMMVTALVTPVTGTILFLMVHHYWTQNFPITLIFDMLGVLKQPEWGETLKMKKTVEDKMDNVSTLFNYFSEQKDYENFRDMHWARKWTYPYTSPLHVLLCLAYTAMLSAFFIIGLTPFPHTQGLMAVYYAAVLLTIGTNIYALSIAVFWILLLIAILYLIIIVIMFTYLYYCLTSQPTHQQRYR